MSDTIKAAAYDVCGSTELDVLAPSFLSAGCGGLEAVREVYDVLGENTVFVNAAGCMTLLSVYPFTPFRGSWLYTSMGSAPAGGQGVRDALDIRRAKGEDRQELARAVPTGRFGHAPPRSRD